MKRRDLIAELEHGGCPTSSRYDFMPASTRSTLDSTDSCRRFPFAIYYDVTDDLARVAAILDMRRDPASIRKELSERG